MNEYRLYEMDWGPRPLIFCVDRFRATEEEAIQRAKARVKGKPIELWVGVHMVRRFDPGREPCLREALL
jgi:hypothetical protein